MKPRLAAVLFFNWIENPSGEYDKQDCERKAFARLSEKIKKHFPRLPLCILADGLYPYAGAFDICRQNDWKFIFVLQDKSLKSVQEELILPKRQKPDLQTQKVDHNDWIDSDYHFVNDIVYQNKYVTNIRLNAAVLSVSATCGRLNSRRTVKHLWNLMTDALIWRVVITENADVKICGPAP